MCICYELEVRNLIWLLFWFEIDIFFKKAYFYDFWSFCIFLSYIQPNKVCFCLIFIMYLSYYCLTLKRHHDQGNLIEKAFNWGLVYSFYRLSHYLHDGEYRNRQTGMLL